jgi:hypothetical protein
MTADLEQRSAIALPIDRQRKWIPPDAYRSDTQFHFFFHSKQAS